MNTVLLFKAIQIAAIGVQFFLFIYTKLQKPSEMQKYASMLSLGTMLMLLGGLLEMQAETLEGSYMGSIIAYLGEPFLLASVFLLICTFYGKKVPRLIFIIMMLYALCISLMVLTNPYHHLYYSLVEYDAAEPFSPLVLKRGPFYAFNVAAAAFYGIGSIVVASVGFKKSASHLKRRLSIYALLMILSAVAGYVVYFLDVSDGYDTTMLGLAAASVFLSILFFRCKVFDVVDKAKDYALDSSSEGLLVYDDTDEPVYWNQMAEKVVGDTIPEEYVSSVSEGRSVYRAGSSVYSVNVNGIRHGDDYLGKSIEINDITDSYNYRERLESEVDAARDKLEDIQRTIVGSFASLVEARSLETGDHIKRVSKYTGLIAHSLRARGLHEDILTDDYINMLVHASPLHDIGKISISDIILMKPGKLTAEEFEEMKKHSAIGSDIIDSTMGGLESEEYVKMASEIALCHHERWDGTGYPRGLKGEEIPLSARIVAVADCFDAMTSKRCYKEAFPDDRALMIVTEESGTHFDPDVVEAFKNSGFLLNR